MKQHAGNKYLIKVEDESEKLKLNKAVRKFNTGQRKDAAMMMYIFFDNMYKRKVKLLRGFSSKKEALTSSSISVVEWNRIYQTQVKTEMARRAVTNIVKDIELERIKMSNSEGENVSIKLLSRYKICERFYADCKRHKKRFTTD